MEEMGEVVTGGFVMDVLADEFMWEEVGVLLVGLGDKLVLDAPGRVLYGLFLVDCTAVIVEFESCPTLSHLELFSVDASFDLGFPCLLPMFAFSEGARAKICAN